MGLALSNVKPLSKSCEPLDNVAYLESRSSKSRSARSRSLFCRTTLAPNISHWSHLEKNIELFWLRRETKESQSSIFIRLSNILIEGGLELWDWALKTGLYEERHYYNIFYFERMKCPWFKMKISSIHIFQSYLVQYLEKTLCAIEFHAYYISKLSLNMYFFISINYGWNYELNKDFCISFNFHKPVSWL